MCILPANAATDRAVITFASSENASRNVAGLPAAARAVREVAAAGIGECWIVAGPHWQPDLVVQGELRRMAGAMQVRWVAPVALPDAMSPGSFLLVSGEKLPGAPAIRAALDGTAVAGDGLTLASRFDDQALARLGTVQGCGELDSAARRIMAGTGKPADGIVSRWINRPVSRIVSGYLLRRWPAIRPIHATLVTALLGIAMFACLLSGSREGLVEGALLFQTASIFDGVDGEIARATFRATNRGAMLDSLIDAFINAGFIGGVAINLWILGNTREAMIGAAGLTIMMLGLFLIGRRARKSDAEFTFNGVKDHFRTGGSRVMIWLTWLTMRDFYALAIATCVILGHAGEALVAFATIAAGWFVVVVHVQVVLSRKAA